MTGRQSILLLLGAFLCAELLGAPAIATPPATGTSPRRSAIAPPLNDAGRPVYPTVESADARKISPGAIGLTPEHQLPSEQLDVVGFRLGIPWVRNWNMTGLDIAIGASETLGAFSGVQFSGLFNAIGSDGAGLQAAGVANLVTGDQTGFQLSSFFNSARNMDGVQISAVNDTASCAAGFQVGLWNDAGDLIGLQIGGANRATDSRGGQIGLWNGAIDARGIQLGAINLADSAHGCQIGVINVAGTMAGLQIGLWNDAQRMSGLQIGLANHIDVSPVPFLPVLNVSF